MPKRKNSKKNSKNKKKAKPAEPVEEPQIDEDDISLSQSSQTSHKTDSSIRRMMSSTSIDEDDSNSDADPTQDNAEEDSSSSSSNVDSQSSAISDKNFQSPWKTNGNGAGYKFISSSKSRRQSRNLTAEHTEMEEIFDEEDNQLRRGCFSKEWNLKRMEREIKQYEATITELRNKDFSSEEKRPKPSKSMDEYKDLENATMSDIEEDDDLDILYQKFRKDLKAWKIEPVKDGETIRAESIKKVQTKLDEQQRVLDAQLLVLADKRKGLTTHKKNGRDIPGQFASRMLKAKDKLLDAVRTYNDAVSKLADDEFNYYLARGHLLFSSQSIVGVYSTELAKIYEMAHDELKKFMDGCRIRSMVEGKDFRRDLSKPYVGEWPNGNFPVMMKEVKAKSKIEAMKKEDPSKVKTKVTKNGGVEEYYEEPQIQIGIKQIEVTSATDFKNPFFDNDDWLDNYIEAYNDEHVNDLKNSNHSDADSDDDSYVPKPNLEHQQSLNF